MRNNPRQTQAGKGDRDRSDPKKFREGLSFMVEWTSEFPRKRGRYMVKYYDGSNKLCFDNVVILLGHEEHYDPFYTVYDEAIGEFIRLNIFAENKVGLKWKFVEPLDC